MIHDARHIIKRHVSTERTSNLRAANGEYVFEVDKNANKYVIKNAVEQAFKVKVERVRTMIIPGKTRRVGRFQPGRTPSRKKAIVRLKKGESISMFENV
jgi:large subunit ribosomal protein L23